MFLKMLNYAGRWLTALLFESVRHGGYARIKSSSPWAIVLSADDVFLKISWRTESIAHEIRNMELLSRFEPLRGLLVPYKYKRQFCFSVIETQRKQPVTDEVELFQVAERILLKFRECAEIKSNNRIDDFEHIANGLDIVGKICGNEAREICSKQIHGLFMDESFFVGPSHGDFHQKNILKDAHGDYYVIDLDCFRVHGIQALDAIYFLVEFYANKNQIGWFEQLALFVEQKQVCSTAEMQFADKFCNISNARWLLLYFLDRISQDRQFAVLASKMSVVEIVEFINMYKRFTPNAGIASYDKRLFM